MTNLTADQIAPAGPSDVPILSWVLARAFHDDPVLSWVIPDPVGRRARLPLLFAAFAEAFLDHGETYLAGEGLGAALWAPPGAEMIPPHHQAWFETRASTILGDDADRAAEIDEVLSEHHPAEPCFYLKLVAVVPEQQGRGLGGRLLTTVLETCDATGVPAYLEATSTENRRLYARHGFDTLDRITVPRGPTLWPMWRNARRGP
ncbi:MAG: GNAT family N-acetyltransferase [Nitriliruptor sp.]|nr:MAG: GNAT family N-acetyltransferase [Nitriliruptor sp.]